MWSPRLYSLAGSAVLLGALCSQAFAWSISGVVQDKATGAPLAGVTINSFNYGGINASTDATGAFSIDENSAALTATKKYSANVRFDGSMLSIENVHANVLKVSMIDALGKVVYQRTLHQVNGYVTLDLSKYTARGVKFARLNTDGANTSYMLSSKGALLKEGDPLPSFGFFKQGYQNKNYQMTQEVETNVIIQMEVASNNPTSSAAISSSSQNTTESSSSAKSSSSKNETPVDCSGKTAKAGDQNLSVNVDGKNRTFILHIPSAYKGDKPVPLVVDYHAVTGNGQGQMSGTTYKAETDPEGVISLYPDGTKSADPSKMGPGWNVGPCCSDDDDIAFSRAMIKKVEEMACIDTKRVYATGFSMGGGMSNHVACFMSDVFAAVAPAGMDLNSVNSAKCNPERPISIIMFRGTQDGTCRWEGGDSGFNDGMNFLGAEGNFKFWADKDGCTGEPTINSDGCREYSNCKDGTKVVLCVDKNVGGGGFFGGGSNGHAQGDGKIGWPFLKQFTLP